VPEPLASAFCRALGKEAFAESRTRQSPALGNALVCRVQDTGYKNTLGKEVFAESRTLGEGGARQRAVSGRLKLTVVNQRRPAKSRKYSAKYFFIFLNQTFCGMFLHYVDLHVPFWDNYNSVFNSQ
jgi:hypothetical protein